MNNKTDEFDLIKLGNQLCFPLYACAKEVIRRYRKPLESINLTYTQYIVMMVLWEFGAMNEKQLGKQLYLDSGTLTPLLKRLEKIGYIKRKRKIDDEREVEVSLTDVGEALKKDALKVPQVLKDCIALSYDEMITLRTLLNKALTEIDKEKEKPNEHL